MYAQLYKLADGCHEHGSDVKSWLTNEPPFLPQTNSKAFSAISFGQIKIIGCISCSFIGDFVLFILHSTRLYTFHAFLNFLTRPHYVHEYKSYLLILYQCFSACYEQCFAANNTQRTLTFPLFRQKWNSGLRVFPCSGRGRCYTIWPAGTGASISQLICSSQAI
jgi:hypothetical protein